MNLIRQAISVQKAVKNARRFREILSTMTRFGFGTVIERMGLRKYLPGKVPEFSEETSQEIDREVKEIVMGEYRRVKKAIEMNCDKIRIIADELLVKETLNKEDVKKLIA